eukprot:12420667-Karenia_brevis.AAC.1
MARMGIPDQLVNICKAMYANPKFYEETGGYRSSIHTQQTVMTSLFEDVHTIVDSDQFENARVSTANFSEVLFADDTICMTSTPSSMNVLLSAIERVGHMYGLTLNKSKCDLIRFNGTSRNGPDHGNMEKT